MCCWSKGLSSSLAIFCYWACLHWGSSWQGDLFYQREQGRSARESEQDRNHKLCCLLLEVAIHHLGQAWCLRSKSLRAAHTQEPACQEMGIICKHVRDCLPQQVTRQGDAMRRKAGSDQMTFRGKGLTVYKQKSSKESKYFHLMIKL